MAIVIKEAEGLKTQIERSPIEDYKANKQDFEHKRKQYVAEQAKNAASVKRSMIVGAVIGGVLMIPVFPVGLILGGFIGKVIEEKKVAKETVSPYDAKIETLRKQIHSRQMCQQPND